MKAYIGPYRKWVGPYQIADKVFFWVDKDPILREDGDQYEKRWDYRAKEWFGEFLAYGFAKKIPTDKFCHDERQMTWFYKLLTWIHSKQKRRIWIKTDRWDHWSADHTMSLLILPILKDLREHKHGAGYTDDEDVPEGLGLRSTEAPPKENEWDTDDNHFKRFDWILDEIIWAHEQIVDDNWEEQYTSGEFDWRTEPDEDRPNLSRIVEGPNHTYKIDIDARQKHQDRIKNGLRLFGKYYSSLWD